MCLNICEVSWKRPTEPFVAWKVVRIRRGGSITNTFCGYSYAYNYGENVDITMGKT